MATLSVVIRNRNEGDHLARLLARLRVQYTQPAEIIVVDNDSTDQSRELIQAYGAKLVHLPVGQFTYGKATNLGFEHAQGDLVLLLSSHSLPVGSFFVDEVLAPFEDPRVAAVRIPIASNTTELKNLAHFPPLGPTSAPHEVYARGPVASGSVLRRSVWLNTKVDESLQAAEDKEWALRVLSQGKWIMPTVNACYVYTKVFSHHSYLAKICREERAGFQTAGLRQRTDPKALVSSILVAFRDALLKVHYHWSIFNFRRSLH